MQYLLCKMIARVIFTFFFLWCVRGHEQGSQGTTIYFAGLVVAGISLAQSAGLACLDVTKQKVALRPSVIRSLPHSVSLQVVR
jgi:hypothetical protein